MHSRKPDRLEYTGYPTTLPADEMEAHKNVMQELVAIRKELYDLKSTTHEFTHNYRNEPGSTIGEYSPIRSVSMNSLANELALGGFAFSVIIPKVTISATTVMQLSLFNSGSVTLMVLNFDIFARTALVEAYLTKTTADPLLGTQALVVNHRADISAGPAGFNATYTAAPPTLTPTFPYIDYALFNTSTGGQMMPPPDLPWILPAGQKTGLTLTMASSGAANPSAMAHIIQLPY